MTERTTLFPRHSCFQGLFTLFGQTAVLVGEINSLTILRKLFHFKRMSFVVAQEKFEHCDKSGNYNRNLEGQIRVECSIWCEEVKKRLCYPPGLWSFEQLSRNTIGCQRYRGLQNFWIKPKTIAKEHCTILGGLPKHQLLKTNEYTS